MKHLFSALFFISYATLAQSAFVPLNDYYYHQIDRLEIKNGAFSQHFNSTLKPLQRKNIGLFLNELNAEDHTGELEYLRADNRDWVDDTASLAPGVFNLFYQNRPDFYYVNTPGFQLHLNPGLHLAYGDERQGGLRPIINTRAAEIHGQIDDKIGFYSYIGENQALFPGYVRDFTSAYDAVPHEGFWKTFRSADSVDFFHVRGYVSFNASKHINVQAGYDRLFLGDGIRSMLISDFTSNYMFGKIDTRVWKLNYVNIFTLMKPDSPSPLSDVPNKYMAMHYLSINLLKNLRIGLFESIVFGTDGFYLPYLNPIIFYRAVEHQNGSRDNALVGADFRWDFLSRFSLYGQFVLDEFLLSNLRERNGWWANKYGGQLGLKYIDAFGIPTLDLQAEANFARPYLYAHTFFTGQNELITSYTHYNQPLAHPLGANFREMVYALRYRPFRNLTLDARLIMAAYGSDTTGVNWGKEVLKDYSEGRPREFGNFTTQGIFTSLMYSDVTLTFMPFHNVFLDLTYVRRRESFENTLNDRHTDFIELALRYNLARRRNEF